MKVLILSADVWEITDEKTGKTNSGCSLWYLNEYREDTIDNLGFKPTKIGANLEVFKSLKNQPLPTLAELDIYTKPGAAGKASLAVRAIKPIKEVKIFN